jgi:hypothetical protein
MKKVIMLATLVIAGTLFTGCGSKSPQVSSEPVSEKLRLEKVTLKLTQKYGTKLQYQSSEELEKRINGKIAALLNEKGILSNDASSDALNINVNYNRRFVGQDSFFKTESLMPPLIAFDIHILKNGKEIRTFKAENLVYNGGFFSNLGTIAGANRTNEYENNAVDTLAHNIVKEVEKLK